MATSGAIRVVVAEDEPILRTGIVRVLEEAGFDVVAQTGDAEDLVRRVGAHKPEVVITDIVMPPDHADDGLRAARAIREERPDIGVLVLSEYLEDRYAMELLGDRPQGVGYLLKHRVGDLATFVEAVRRVAGGGTVLDPAVVHRMLGRRRSASPLDALTGREREVLTLMAEGRSNQGIAHDLVITVAAVERHVTSILAKLGLRPTTEGHEHRRVLAVLRYLADQRPEPRIGRTAEHEQAASHPAG